MKPTTPAMSRVTPGFPRPHRETPSSVFFSRSATPTDASDIALYVPVACFSTRPELTQSTPDSSAKPTPIRARLDKFQTVDEFAAGYQQHFLPDGIRLPTRQVKPVGTRIALKLELATGATALRADGVVEAIRENSDGQPIGMDIRFEKIEPNSRRLIERMQADRSEKEN